MDITTIQTAAYEAPSLAVTLSKHDAEGMLWYDITDTEWERVRQQLADNEEFQEALEQAVSQALLTAGWDLATRRGVTPGDLIR